MNKKIISFLLTIVMVLGILPLGAFADTTKANAFAEPFNFIDMPDNWSTEALEKAANNGLLSGYGAGVNKYIKADNNLTRAEMAAVVNRAFASVKTADISQVSDVDLAAWYGKDLAKAVKMRTFAYDTKMRPHDKITRQEAFTVLARAFKLTCDEEDYITLDKFSDKADIAEWALASLEGMAAAGYIQGSNGKLNPTANITRAEFAVVMDNMVDEYIDQAGVVTQVADTGNVLIREAGVVLKDLTVNGDLIIADGVGEGEITLDNVKVEGRTIIRGGGENSINIMGESGLDKVVLAKVDGKLTVKVKGDASVETIYVCDGLDDVIIEGKVGTLEAKGNERIAYAINATLANAIVSGNHSKIIIGESSTLKNSLVTGQDSEIIVLTGNKGGSGSSSGSSGGGAGGASGGSGSGGGSVAVTTIKIDPADTNMKVKELQLTATITPNDATNQKVVWSSSNTDIATVDANGKVSLLAVTKASITITATTEDGNKTDSVNLDVLLVAENAVDLKEALASAKAGDIIYMMPGNYIMTETLTITTSVSIIGPQAGVDPRPSENSARTNDANETVLTGNNAIATLFIIKANDVVVDGIIMEETSNHIIQTDESNITGVKIINNIVRHGRGNEGIKVSNTVDPLVQFNYIYDIASPGDAIEAVGAKGFRILDNEIDGVASVNGAIRLQNNDSSANGIVARNIIRNTEYSFAIDLRSSLGNVVIDSNTIENASTGGIFIYKNKGPATITVSDNVITNYAAAPPTGSGSVDKYLNGAASAIAVSYNVKGGVQPNIIITGNTTENGYSTRPAIHFGGGTPADVDETDLTKVLVTYNSFDRTSLEAIWYVTGKTAGLLDLSTNSWK